MVLYIFLKDLDIVSIDEQGDIQSIDSSLKSDSENLLEFFSILILKFESELIFNKLHVFKNVFNLGQRVGSIVLQ